ncbi:uncharacterized protein LOC129314475 [Prosopis cineraria]|uniref:uncharacterized protein LOC129314475 n=1 Tax=Prosopis cineraria TaxID=364024 RepID=UPI00241004EC|nr:uncharacterized protein LOC129314475 [Prosopis cineraria]
MEETDSKMSLELIAKALLDTIAKSHELREALAAWAEASKAKTEASKAKAEAYKAKAERYKGERSKEVTSSSSSEYSLAKCMVILDKMAKLGISESDYMKTLKILKSDPGLREEFFLT